MVLVDSVRNTVCDPCTVVGCALLTYESATATTVVAAPEADGRNDTTATVNPATSAPARATGTRPFVRTHRRTTDPSRKEHFDGERELTDGADAVCAPSEV